MDCITKPKELVEYAQEIGLKGIVCTDHESLGAHVELDKIRTQLRNEDSDFKIGLGNEIYLTDNREPGQKYFHFILIAKDAIGHHMLRELSSTAWENSYFDRGLERVPTLKSELKDIISRHGKGHLIASTACLGSELDFYILKMYEAEKMRDKQGKKDAYQKIIDLMTFLDSLFGDDLYLEIQPAQSQEQLAVNKRMPAIAKYFNKKIIVTTDAHYLKKEDREIHKAYLNSKGGEREVDSFYEYAYLQTTEEVIENLEGTELDYYELEANTLEIYNKIEDFTLARKQHVPQVEVEYFVPDNNVDKNFKEKYPTLTWLLEEGNDQERYWINICLRKLEQLNKFNNEYLARLEEEADINKVIGEKLETCMFAYPIFLQHYIDMFWECGSTVGAGRGSACAGLNHYLLGITQLDPIQHSLPYWRLDIQ